MDIASKYDPSTIEDKWYQFWLENRYFHSEPDEREPYCVVIPPPNVTGVLHMGHMLNNTIQDVMVRRARMQGKNACWVPGTDHASIATEAKVVKMLADQGIAKKDLTREEFLKYAYDWKDKYGGIILEQLKKLGASCDWDRTRFTMEPKLYDAVISVFIDLYKKGLIYRGTRMVNWDPQGKTTLSDEEVLFKEATDKLYYVKYKIEGSEEYISVATARPETIAGDVAVCVHPEDERYLHLHGKNVVVPLINRLVPVITDTYIDREFGTGVLKVTPAHDIHDYEIGLKHNLPVYDTLNDDGTIAEAGILFIGKDRFEARDLWEAELKNQGLLIQTDAYVHNIGTSERTGAVVEPKISTQWFLDMKKFMEKNPEVLSSVMSDEVLFTPSKFKNVYKHWIENIKDWNISRQLWWGQQIPAWYTEKGEFAVAKTAEEAVIEFKNQGIETTAASLTQDPDVLDTWFSSWLWPISVFDGFDEANDKKEVDYYYPTCDLVTAPEIIFFWVARMIMAGYEYKGKKPFNTVYFTGIVRDKQRRKMSKSLGNSPDPLDLIAQYGADAVRMGMLLCSPAGNDILFDESQVEQGRNFCNKLWNAFRLIQNWQIDEHASYPNSSAQAHQWFQRRANDVIKQIDEDFKNYRLNEALMGVYKLIWDDFCSVYLEAIKPPYGEGISKQAKSESQEIYSMLCRLLHPFMPFITEELYYYLNDGKPEKPCVISEYPKAQDISTGTDLPVQVVSEIRNIRSSKGISPKEQLEVVILTNDAALWMECIDMIGKLSNTSISLNGSKPENALAFLAGKDEAYLKLNITIDTVAEKSKINEEINYLNGFLKSVSVKLDNEKFVANAKPEVLAKEQQKKADAEEKLKALNIALAALN